MNDFEYESLSKELEICKKRILQLEFDLSSLMYTSMVVLAIAHDKMGVTDEEIKKYSSDMTNVLHKSMLNNASIPNSEFKN
jgi:hypothetical protein